jgi:glyoxylase I family protein
VTIMWGVAPKRAVMLDTGDGNYLEVFEDVNFLAAENGAVLHFALRTTRLDEVAERVRGFGIKITIEPKDVTLSTTNGRGAIPIRICFFVGPNSEVVELFQNELT